MVYELPVVLLEQTLREEIAAWPHVSALLGTTTAERDAVFAEAFDLLQARVAEAKAAGRATDVDGSGISFVLEGDTYHVAVDGEVTRRLTPDSRTFEVSTASPLLVTSTRCPSREALLRAHSAAWLAPSATNWQPLRVVMMDETVLGLPNARVGAEAFVLYRRPHYVSLLGDILELFGLQATAHEEDIDAALYLETLALILADAGTAMTLLPLSGRQPDPVSHASVERLRTALGRTAREFEPYAVARFFGAEAALGPLARMVLSRTSHRVASPHRGLLVADVQAVDTAVAHAISSACRVTWLEQSHPAVPAIGEAMFAAMYGDGADSKTKAGGQGGILEAFAPEKLDERLRQRGASLDSGVDVVGSFLEERLSEGGRYSRAGGVLVNAKGEPLTYKQLARLTRTFAAAMGTHFLQFKNTHPVVGLVWAPKGADGAASAGRYAARMLLASRAKGWASIIKTGPIDLAEARIARLLVDRGVVEASLLDTYRPALTLQLGWPIADEKLDPTDPTSRHGLAYRERDKRPPRLHPLDVVF